MRTRAKSPGSTSFKRLFSRCLAENPGLLHFAAHSHHLWPDVTREAHLRAWDDAARLLDRKWERVFGELVPQTQRGIAARLGLSRPERIAFAPNTHELVVRIVSSLPANGRPARILSTGSEFHSFQRQCRRWVEAGLVELETVPTEPFETFPDRFLEAAREERELVFCSHVFFDSGFVFEEFQELAAVAPPETVLVVDGYHGFLALPTDLGAVEERVFYLSGGYKYAMSGEGACFLHCPDGYLPRPVDTGWFACFDELSSTSVPGSKARAVEVRYGAAGQRFLGATFDPSGLYRLRAVLGLLDAEGIAVEDVHAHVLGVQDVFTEALATDPPAGLADATLVAAAPGRERAHFLAFRTPRAAELHGRLEEAGVRTDYRHENLRFGFGLYHDAEDVLALFERMRKAL